MHSWLCAGLRTVMCVHACMRTLTLTICSWAGPHITTSPQCVHQQVLSWTLLKAWGAATAALRAGMRRRCVCLGCLGAIFPLDQASVAAACDSLAFTCSLASGGEQALPPLTALVCTCTASKCTACHQPAAPSNGASDGRPAVHPPQPPPPPPLCAQSLYHGAGLRRGRACQDCGNCCCQHGRGGCRGGE